MTGIILAYSALSRFSEESRQALSELVAALSAPLKLAVPANGENKGLTGQQIGAVNAVLDNVRKDQDPPGLGLIRTMFYGTGGAGTFVNNGNFHDTRDAEIDKGYEKARRIKLDALMELPGAVALQNASASAKDAGPDRPSAGSMPGGKPARAAYTAG